MFLSVPGARIAEYSHLYEQVMFKEPSSTPVLKSSVSIAGPHPLFTHSSPNLPRTSSPDADWLNCTYSNGELSGFVSWPSEVNPQCRLTPAVSVPSLRDLPQTPGRPAGQRWSSCVSPSGGGSDDGDDPEHVYSTLGPRDSVTPPYSRCRSSTSLAEVQENSGSVGNLGSDRNPSRGLGPRQHSLPESTSQSSDLTLRDSQQVLVLRKSAALNAARSKQNYLNNFKDDDDDYVEIRSEDEHDEQSTNLHPGPDQSWNDSWTGDGLSGPGQTKIVRSLREKFQCLGSSSFV